VLNERLDEYAETVLRVAKGNASDIEEYRRMHAASITELRRTGTETADSLARLAGRMEELVTTQADDERRADANDRLAAMEATLSRLTVEVAELAATAEIPQDPVLQLDDAQIKALAAAVAEVLAARIPVTRIRNELRATPTVSGPARRGPTGSSAPDADLEPPAARRPRRTNPIQVRGSDRPPS
ncbi:MAG: hypothetical protein M3535_03865, partial [Actinomycetota bacterium]|nr:hypothetical protein [Actinomycetota bacterium]